jgi:hypothetical protein
MTLRFRLVLALVALGAVGLAVFGIATYTAFAGAAPTPRRRLGLGAVRDRSALREGRRGRPPRPPGGDQPGGGGDRPSGTYAGCDPGGAVVATLSTGLDRQPSLPATSSARSGPACSRPARPRFGPVAASVSESDHHDSDAIVVAVPRTATASLNRWSSSRRGRRALLAALAVGAWLILRRGSARSSTWPRRPAPSAPATSPSASPADGRSEVGQLGLALNTMLGELGGVAGARPSTGCASSWPTPPTTAPPAHLDQGFASCSRSPTRRTTSTSPSSCAASKGVGANEGLVEDLLLARLDGPARSSGLRRSRRARRWRVQRRRHRPIQAGRSPSARPAIIVFGDGPPPPGHRQPGVQTAPHTVAGTPIEVSAARTNGLPPSSSGTTARARCGRPPPRLRPVLASRSCPGRVRLGLGLSIVAAIAQGTAATSRWSHTGGGARFRPPPP